MIYDSRKWKKELIRKKRQLYVLCSIKWTDRLFDLYSHKIDLVLLTTAIIIRKLLESDRLSDEADCYRICVTKYIPRRQVDRLHSWVEDGDYEWGDGILEQVSARTICNSLIHSYAYCPRFSNRRKLAGFLVTSDFNRNEFIYDVDIDNWLKYMTFISDDSICEGSIHFNEKKHDYETTIKKRG